MLYINLINHTNSTNVTVFVEHVQFFIMDITHFESKQSHFWTPQSITTEIWWLQTFNRFLSSRKMCSLLNLYRPRPLQTSLLFMMIQTQLDSLFKTCSDTRRKFEAIRWLLLSMCQTNRQGAFAKLEKHTTGVLDFGLLPSCTGHSHVAKHKSPKVERYCLNQR